MSGHKAAYDDLDTTMIAYVGVVGTIITFFTVFAVAALSNKFESNQTEIKVVEAPEVNSDSLLANQAAALSEYRWIDQDKKIVAVPIDRAMEIVVQEEQEKQKQAKTEKP
ncbi:hypothetical protein [Gimesia maris]|uniref:Uncharacterized protein n=1 Tax=Gimesia maris TaxID=122 RepID=A0ABX5YVL8_9PLAN|nr:hypothetical protein [Gimesia maris]EDL58454.1 hypothetical protein PM8797T_11871 [Gimesia maris DSM 8797]QDU17724.1 hypothetical protein CA11_55720 [Gimesia maris]QEG19750.1 hypothetical protein GmarT_56560 [Gimesia maris]QGQ27426.1 hypothetical protein F1729_01460 [Gimesia maris]